MKVINIKGIKKIFDEFRVAIEVYVNDEERNLILDSLKLDIELELKNKKGEQEK